MPDGQPSPNMILSAHRTTSRAIPQANSPASKQGIRYEHNVARALKTLCDAHGAALEVQPWFAYETPRTLSHVVPDLILNIGDLTLVIEVKLTYIPEAHTKLQILYLPVITKALDTRARRIRGLVICKHLIPGATNLIEFIHESFTEAGPIPTLQYMGGKFPW